MIYTGIGSRKTPQSVLDTMTSIGQMLALEGDILRSGGASGADTAFEAGCDSASGEKEIYLPWKGFNGSKSSFYTVDQGALKLAELIHPNWKACSQGAQKLHARNCYQVLGLDLLTPSDIILCYTEGGKPLGGTATAITLADQRKIPVINLGAEKWQKLQLTEILYRFQHFSRLRNQRGK